MNGLVDTAIVIDLIRGFPDAHEWLVDTEETFGVSDYVWLEVIQGATNKQKQKAAIDILSDFQLVETTSEDTRWAVEALISARLSHNVDPFDCLIAATSHRLQIPLYTRNLKHFTPLIGELARQPY